jgi:HTH-type transcriptional regulator/antitoxin HigA
LGQSSLDDKPTFQFHAARKATTYSEVNLPQVAWLHQARHFAEPLEPMGNFTNHSLRWVLDSLKQAARDTEGVSAAPDILSEAGIRFVVVEHLPKTRIDGATFWLEDGSPVIAMSMRYQRIDHFWHTLFHELGHVMARDGFDDKRRGWIDTDLPGSHTPVIGERPASEAAADDFATSSLINPHALEVFISFNRPLFSRRKIVDFARSLDVHPGILVGQLQYRGEILYSHSRDLLVSVRDIIVASAETDGWKKSKGSA